MPLTEDEKHALREWILSKSCNEFRAGEPCIQRKATTAMIGDMHEGCYWVQRILALVDHA